MSKYDQEVDQDTLIISNMVKVAHVEGYEKAKEYLDEHLCRQGFLNASIILYVLSNLALDLAKIEDPKLFEVFRNEFKQNE